MASNNTIPCGPCKEGKENNNADFWCYNCDEGLCPTCFSHHKISKSSDDHKTIEIKSYKPPIQAIKTECDKHSQQLSLYCPSHLMPCCDECISTIHSKCTGIKSLASVVEKTTIEISKQSVDRDINSIIQIFDEMINNRLKNIETGEQQCEEIKESIGRIRYEINKHLKILEKKLYQEANTILEQEKSKATELITDIKKKKRKLKKNQRNLHMVTTHPSKQLSFLGVHQIEQKVHKCQQFIENLENDARAKKVDIILMQNHKIKKVLRRLGSLESLGEVTAANTDIAINREECVRRKAQVKSREGYSIENMTLNIDTEINISKHNRLVSDMICLMDGRILVVEDRNACILVTSDYKLQKTLPITGMPVGVAQINQNNIAITYPYEFVIKIYNMESEKVNKTVKLHKTCWGLSYSNNTLAIGLHGSEICIIDLEGKILKSLQVHCSSLLWCLVYRNDRVIYSDIEGNAVYCVDESGKQIWQYKQQDLTNPYGLCTDSYGNILVVFSRSNIIIVVSKDGQENKVLFSGENQGFVLNHRCICIKPNESSGLLSGGRYNYITQFNLSSE